MFNASTAKKSFALLLTFAACFAANATARAVDFDNGGVGNDWNTPLNWTTDAVPTAADDVFIGDTEAGPITIALANPLNQIDELGLGRNLAGTFTINHSAGILTTNNWTNIGQGFGAGSSVGIYNLSGGSVTKQGGGNNVFGGFATARGELHITGSATWNVNTGFTALGGEDAAVAKAGTVGIVTVGGTGEFNNTGGVVYVGRGGTGTFTHNSTATSDFTGGGLEIANLAQGMGTVEVNAGTLNVAGADIQIGRGNTTNTPILDINGGSVTHNVNTVIGRDGRGIIDISGSGSFQTNWLIVGEGGANASSQLNVGDSSTLTTTRITQGLGGATNGSIEITGSGATVTTNELDVITAGSNTMSWIADAGGVSEIDVNGNVTLGNATLSVDLSQYTGSATTLTLIDKTNAGAVSGTFLGLAEGAPVLGTGLAIDPTISYLGGGGDNNNVVLNGVFAPPTAPEPSTFILAALGLMGVTLRRRSRRNRNQ